MPRLETIESPRSVGKQTMKVRRRKETPLPLSSSQPVQSASQKKKPATGEQKSDRALTSRRKERWNALVRKSAPLTIDGVSVTAAAGGTQGRENDIAVANACSGSAERWTNSGRHSASCRTASMSSLSASSHSRLYVDLSRETEKSNDCPSRKKYRDRCLIVSRSSSPTSVKSSSSRRKRRRLNADCCTATTTTTTCGCCRDDDSCRSDRHRSRCCQLQHGCCCRCTCRRELYCHYDDNRRAFRDVKRYAAPPSNYRQSARHCASDERAIDIAPTEQCVLSRSDVTRSSYIHEMPGTTRHHPLIAGASGLGQSLDGKRRIKQEPPEDSLDLAHRRSCRMPSTSSFSTHANNTSSIHGSVESCPIPLEPVNIVPLDPRRLRQRQLATSLTTVRTNADELDVIQLGKVERITALIQNNFSIVAEKLH